MLAENTEAVIARSGAFKLSGLYVTPPVTFRHSVGLITHMFQSVGTQGRSQSINDAARVPKENACSLKSQIYC